MLVLALVRPARDAYRSLLRRHPVRVFTFHRVTHLCRDGMTIAPELLRRQLTYLARFHRLVPLDEALRLLESNARLSRPVAAITFDDGYRSVREPAGTIFRDLGVAGATCFLSTDLVGTDRRFAHDEGNPVAELLDVMSWDDVRALRAEGWTFGGHTATHARLSACPTPVRDRELTAPLDALRRELRLQSPTMSYPFGAPSDITEEGLGAIRRLGYRACLSNFGGENWGGTDPFRVARIDLGGDHDTIGWKTMAHGLRLTSLARYWPPGAVTA
jgi:peptidoglycan/xylan/chitin deacetylase (PgdA/CDA1 family)